MAVISAMSDSMIRGGPDGSGCFVDSAERLALGHRRLSIIDLSESGGQPMKHNGLVMVYNVEVYNFKAIKEELIGLGYKFVSSCDSEVVLKAFDRWGLACVDRFRGMFAIAIWDSSSRSIFLIRDRMGVKPLYWYYKDGLFMFSSELKAFHRHPGFDREIDRQGLFLYLKYGYIPAPFSVFKHVRKLEPGHILVFDGRSVSIRCYWDAADLYFDKARSKRSIRPEEELEEELEELLVDSFKLRTIADVDFGVFLSGGVDSSLVCALLAREGFHLKTFTVGFDFQSFDESRHARSVADYLGTDHHEDFCTSKEAMGLIGDLPDIYDEPLGDPSCIPTYLVSKMASKRVKVVLSADGGDELFGGYSRYIYGLKLKKILLGAPLVRTLSNWAFEVLGVEGFSKFTRAASRILPFLRSFPSRAEKLASVLKASGFAELYGLIVSCFTEDEMGRMLTGDFALAGPGEPKAFEPDGAVDLVDFMTLFDIKNYLPDDILCKVDRASMFASIESREPLLDHKLVEWAIKLPSGFKIRDGVTKYLLKRVLFKHLPRELVDRPKMGFGAPVGEWMRGDLRDMVVERLSDGFLVSSGVFRREGLARALKLFFEESAFNPHKLWLLFCLELWGERWL